MRPSMKGTIVNENFIETMTSLRSNLKQQYIHPDDHNITFVVDHGQYNAWSPKAFSEMSDEEVEAFKQRVVKQSDE